MKTLIINGTIVTSTERYRSDILITDGRISHIESRIKSEDIDKIIDAKGYYIIPGGIDPHVHMHLANPAGFSSDDFFTGSRAALYGGTTTLIDFVTPLRGETLPDALVKRKEEAKNSMTDISFHITPVEWRDTTAHEIDECFEEGVTSFKVYMAYKDSIGLNESDLFNIMKTVGKSGGIVAIHCESGDEIEILRSGYFSGHHSEPEYHALSRPAMFEAGAVEKAIDLAYQAECQLYIVHVSTQESLKHIEKAQLRGQKVFAETCPQYLLLDDTKYIGDFKSTAPFIISPPLRKKEDNDALWNAISQGIISSIGTDHCPFFLSQKAYGFMDFRKIPNGAGGVEHRLELLYTFGVLNNRISLNQLVDIFSTQPARIFGLYPAKGDIIVGSDADLVIWNPDHDNIISAGSHHQNCDINIYEGIKTKGAPEYVISGGKVAVENKKLVAPEIRGKFLKR